MNTFAIIAIAWIALCGVLAFAALYAAYQWANRARAEADAGLDDLLDHLDTMGVARATGVVAPKPYRPTRTVTFRCVGRSWTRGGAS